MLCSFVLGEEIPLGPAQQCWLQSPETQRSVVVETGPCFGIWVGSKQVSRAGKPKEKEPEPETCSFIALGCVRGSMCWWQQRGDQCPCTGGAVRTFRAQTSPPRTMFSVPPAEHHCNSQLAMSSKYLYPRTLLPAFALREEGTSMSVPSADLCVSLWFSLSKNPQTCRSTMTHFKASTKPLAPVVCSLFP